MKTVLILAAIVALAFGGAVPYHQQFKTKSVDAVFVEQQKKILSLFYNINQLDTTADYYKCGFQYSIEANIENYTDHYAVEEFLTLQKTGFMPRYHLFSIFKDKQRQEAIALFKLFYYAKDFETFYNTASWARIYFNQGMFLYAYYTAVIQREDCKQFLLPAPYEVYPEFFVSSGPWHDVLRVRQQGEKFQFPEVAAKYGMVKENEDFVFYANYSDYTTYPNGEQRISYFTEDVGLNSYYYYFHSVLPFWWNGNKLGSLKEYRGEIYFFFYQQLLARYYMERLSNGLGEIPWFSWYSPIRVGYYPKLVSYMYPFAQRPNYHIVHDQQNFEPIRFLDIYEKTFFQFLQKGKFKSFDQEVDFHDPKYINFVGNYWQTNADLYGENLTQTYHRSYEMTARKVLSAAPEPFDSYYFMPSALDFYQTSLRDPAFYQLYNKIFDYMSQYKKYLKPYNHDDLHYVGVKISDVKIDKLETYFSLYDFDATNMVNFDKEYKNYPHKYWIRQPRLTHKPFTISVDVKSDVETEATFKIWIGPKYDSQGYPISLEDNWMNFFELTWYTQKLKPGMNTMKFDSEDFFLFKEDSLPMAKIFELLNEGKIPDYMSEKFNNMPKRLMLPKGTKGGFPYQFVVFAYPTNSIVKDTTNKFKDLFASKVLGFPFDRPVKSQYFRQPNIFFKDVFIYHEGEDHAYKYATPFYAKH